MGKTLEQIYWEKGRFVKENGEIVNPKPFESPLNVFTRGNNQKEVGMEICYCFQNDPKKWQKYSEANAFSASDESHEITSKNGFINGYLWDIQFYKI